MGQQSCRKRLATRSAERAKKAESRSRRSRYGSWHGWPLMTDWRLPERWKPLSRKSLADRNQADHGRRCHSGQPASRGLFWRSLQPTHRCDRVSRGHGSRNEGGENLRLQANQDYLVSADQELSPRTSSTTNSWRPCWSDASAQHPRVCLRRPAAYIAAAQC